MAKYKPQYKDSNGNIQDLDLVAKYDSDGNQINTTYLKETKVLNTTATTAQSTSASETISGSGTITLHKVAKTGTYSDLIGTPTIPSITNCVKYDDTIQNTNPFGGKKLYLNSIDNAFASADKKYYVTITKHKKSDNGITYPYTDSTKTITDDDYYVDGPVTATLTSSAHNIFNGSYEDGISCSGTEYLKIRVMFGSNTSPSGSSSY